MRQSAPPLSQPVDRHRLTCMPHPSALQSTSTTRRRRSCPRSSRQRTSLERKPSSRSTRTARRSRATGTCPSARLPRRALSLSFWLGLTIWLSIGRQPHLRACAGGAQRRHGRFRAAAHGSPEAPDRGFLRRAGHGRALRGAGGPSMAALSVALHTHAAQVARLCASPLISAHSRRSRGGWGGGGSDTTFVQRRRGRERPAARELQSMTGFERARTRGVSSTCGLARSSSFAIRAAGGGFGPDTKGSSQRSDSPGRRPFRPSVEGAGADISRARPKDG